MASTGKDQSFCRLLSCASSWTMVKQELNPLLDVPQGEFLQNL